MSLIDRQVCIGGMTCVNCENKILKRLKETAGIVKASVSYQTGMAQISYDPDQISFDEISEIIEQLDYEVISGEEAGFDIARTISFLAIIIGLYILLQQFGILNLLVPSQLADNSMGYGMLFVVGLLTSVHCIAMCGGINLSQSIPRKAVSTEKAVFLPAVLYNLGRVVSYTAIGFVLGLIGWMLGGGTQSWISPYVQGVLKWIAGVLMIVMGINMLGIFPWLRKFTIRMPKAVAQIGRKGMTNTKPFVVGCLNGFMPCGPMQSMQILALSSGNPFAGALSMFLFSLGTVPLMLGLGSLVSALGKKFAKSVLSVGAVLVIVLGLAMFSQGSALAGMQFAGGLLSNNQKSDEVQMIDGVQIVNSTLSPGQYPDITVQAGIPVEWNIYVPEGCINGCNYRMIIPAYGLAYSFAEGENVITFTPDEAGDISYSCWMGMIRGNISVQ